MKRLIIIFFVFSVFAVSCKSTESTSMEGLKQNLHTNDSDNVNCILNEDESYTLCYTEIDSSDALKVNALVKFSIIENETNNEIFSDSNNGGYVKWISNTKIEFYSPPGVIPKGKYKSDYTKIYDVTTNEVTKQSERKM